MKRTYKVEFLDDDDNAIITETITRRCGFLWLRTTTETIVYHGREGEYVFYRHGVRCEVFNDDILYGVWHREAKPRMDEREARKCHERWKQGIDFRGAMDKSGVQTCRNYCAAYSSATVATREWCDVHHHDLLGRSDNTVCDDVIERGEHYGKYCGDCQAENKSTRCVGCIGSEFFVAKTEANDEP